MQYYQFLIYVHRPFISRQSQDCFHYIQALHACISAAVNIASLLRIYSTTYSVRYVNVEVVSVIFSAAIIFIFVSVSELVDDDRTEIVAGLETCCKGLAELGRVFHNATRTLEVLLDIKRKWQAQVVASIGTKRRISAILQANQTQKKRPNSQIVVGQIQQPIMGVGGGNNRMVQTF
jgi:hypothetical protein